ncbi:hypothetical protein [uncultured Kordia sp.]|nr:hypothetical protein [uncultured Kordia sp.]
MKKQTLKKLALKKAQISKLENVKGGVHAQTCIGLICANTLFLICPARM